MTNTPVPPPDGHDPQSADSESLAGYASAESPADESRTRLHRPEEAVVDINRAGRSDRRRVRWQIPIMALAAAAILAIGIAGYLKSRPGDAAPPVALTSRMTATGVGAVDSLTLPDGTRVILGPLSSVTVVKGYGIGRREVDIRGEAFFDVVHNVSSPFTARALGVTITDIGTSFAVRADSTIGVSVAVRDGTLALKRSDTTNASGVILGAGQYALLALNGQTTTRPATEQDVAWMKRRVVFREAPMSEVSESFRRWYGINLRVTGPSIEKRRLTATLSGETPEAALEIVSLSLGGTVERRGDTAIVHARERSTGLR